MRAADTARAMSVVGQVAAITSSDSGRRERAEEILAALRRIVPHVAAEIVMLDPFDRESRVVASTGYSDEVLADLHSPAFHEIMRELDLPRTGRPVRMRDLPGDPLDNWAVSDVLMPAGYVEGMTMCLRTADGRVTGVMNLSVDTTDHPTDVARDAIWSVCSALGNLVDATQGPRLMQTILGSGSLLVGLDVDGGTVDLPGAATHRLLEPGSDLLAVARRERMQRTWSTFLWPDEDSWVRVRVLACPSEEPITTVVGIDPIDIDPLSRRELEVLTLATEGMSNGEISAALVVSQRTVATHIEHILSKLHAPNRAAAAAYALREGLILGRVECPGRLPGARGG